MKPTKDAKIDDTDQKILTALRRNSKLSYRGLAKTLMMPITTVHHRIRKLEQQGVIKRYTINVNNTKLGRTVCAYILLRVDYSTLKSRNISQQSLALKLKQRDDVEDAALITGIRDIILKVRAHSIDELNQLVTKDLRTMAGVKSTETLVVLDELE